MRRFWMAVVSATALIVSATPARAYVDANSTAGDAVAEFFKCMNVNRIDDANALFQVFPKVPRKVNRAVLVDDAAQGRYRGYRVADFQQGANVAVVLVMVDEKDAAAFWLLRRNNVWKLVPGLNDITDGRIVLEKKEKAEIKPLKKWFREHEKQFEPR